MKPILHVMSIKNNSKVPPCV